MKILVAAFDPFGGETVNPALEAVKRLPDSIAGAQIARVEVPTVFRGSIISAVNAIQREQPDAVICVGQAGGRRGMTVERVAINIEDASIADNSGVAPIDRPIATEGPAAYFATLPIKAIISAMREDGLEASVSNTAGTFVCNHLMYGVLHYLDQAGARASTGEPVRSGFIHVPYSPEQSDTAPTMATEEVVRGLVAAIKATVTTRVDDERAEGATH